MILEKIEIHLKDGSVWLTELEIAELFQTTRQNVNKHINNIVSDGEIEEEVGSNYQLRTMEDGAIKEKTQIQEVRVCNLDIFSTSVDYDGKSERDTDFF